MSNYRRFRVEGATYFFTVNLADRQSHALVDHIDVLRWAFAATMATRPFQCDAMVVLPDHLHAVWTLPPGDADYSTRWGAIKSRFVMGMRRAGFSPPMELPGVVSGRFAGLKPGLRQEKREVGVWQRRFWEHCIRDEADYRAHVAYCWGNPVKHGNVEHAVDWPYSSIHRDVRLGVVDPEWCGVVSEGLYGE
ncbi:MAG: transposase [Pseudomonadota bacterium]